jgi:hypothetical protein
MTWGKIATTAATVFLLTGCSAPAPQASSPTAEPSPSATSDLVIETITGEPKVDKFIAILNASCKLAESVGLVVTTPGKNLTTYGFPATNTLLGWDPWNVMTKTTDGYELDGWFSVDGDIVCNEAGYANRVVPEGTPPNSEGVTFAYKYVEVEQGTVDWSVYRQSPSLSPVRVTFANGLVTSVRFPSDNYLLEFGYGPFTKALKDIHKSLLKKSGKQYMYLTPPMWGMTLDEAKAYAKKQGLTVVVGAQDDEIFEVEGPSDPKRMIVNIMEGEVVFVWTE